MDSCGLDWVDLFSSSKFRALLCTTGVKRVPPGLVAHLNGKKVPVCTEWCAFSGAGERKSCEMNGKTDGNDFPFVYFECTR